MTEQTQELTEDLDAWKAVSPGAGQLRGVRDFRLLEDEWTSATRAVSLEMAKLQALGKGELEEQLAQAKGVMSELFASYRETPLLVENCIVRKADGEFCDASIGKQKGSAGDVSSNLQVCGRHCELHALWRVVNHLEMTSYGEQPQADEPLAPVLRSGNCRTCLEPMGSRELKESCVCCFTTVHQVYLTEQLVNADWSAVKDQSAVELFCSGCIVERFMEVCLLVSLLRETGAEFAIFEPIVDAFVSEKGEGVWTRCARNAVKVWACTLASVKKPPLPWTKGPKPGSEELLVEVPLALVAEKLLALKAMLLPSAEVKGGGASSSGLGSGEGESALAQRIDELQRQISQMALPLAPELRMALALFDAPERMRGSTVCVKGSLDGYKPGAAGAPNTAELITRLDYLGMRPVTMQDKARMQRYIGADRVDLFVRFRDCAEAQGVQQSFMLGEMAVQATRSKKLRRL
jgi:hypothetical protein